MNSISKIIKIGVHSNKFKKNIKILVVGLRVLMTDGEKKYIMAIGARIREIRKSKNMAQKELAYTCDLDISTMNRIEAGVYIPRITTLKTIAHALEISIGEIVDL